MAKGPLVLVGVFCAVAAWGLEGDFDNNGAVDFEDFFVFADSYGSTLPSRDAR